WYGDVDDDQGWAEEDDENDFLPGLTSGTSRAGTRLDDRQARGGRSGRSGRSGGKRKSRMRRIAQWLAISVILLLVLGAGGAYYYVDHFYLHPPDYSGPGTGSLTVRIYPGDTAAVVGQRLQQAGVVETARAFQNAAKASGKGSTLEPGYYRVHRHMAAALAFALLLKPSSRIQTRITIPEGQRLSQIIAELGQGTKNLSGYQQAIKDVPALDLPSFAKANPEGYLFPATYDIQPNTPPVKVLQAMVTRFGVEAASVSLPSAAAHAQLTEDQVIVVASLIQAEGRNPADFPKIAEVIYNRLNSGIKLQLDSTVMYALHTYGIRATSAQARVRSPYNTYVHTGLPPTPIDSPGDVAIRAALHPDHGNLLYFVTVDPKTGLTKFTSSFTVAQQYEAELSANLAKGR
ncbi:MAG TPA: endolytic transglycosylase MltG, partial [Streptosporangiaceae bacterium]